MHARTQLNIKLLDRVICPINLKGFAGCQNPHAGSYITDLFRAVIEISMCPRQHETKLEHAALWYQ